MRSSAGQSVFGERVTILQQCADKGTRMETDTSKLLLKEAAPHFESQLLADEIILWAGQPEKNAFGQNESRLTNLIIGYILAWSFAWEARMIWVHGLSFSHLMLTISGLAAALSIKILFKFTASNAGSYWYAVTDRRVLAEFPDDGSHTLFAMNLIDVSSLSLKRQAGHGGVSDSGTILITANTRGNNQIRLQCISHSEHVYSILKQITGNVH